MLKGEYVTTCIYCDGDGCEECGQSGQKVRTRIDAGDGVTLNVSGDVTLDAEQVEALSWLAREAFRKMAADRG